MFLMRCQSWYLFLLNLNVFIMPIPAAITAGGTILSSLLGGIFSSNSQASANAANIQMARESQDWQSAENQKSRDWQEMMWNKQNEFNSPAHMRELYRQGGYNPYLLGSENLGAGAGSAGTPSQTGAPNVAHVAPVNPLSGLSEGIQRGSDQFAKYLSLYQQGQQIESNVSMQYAKEMESIYKILFDAYEKGGQKLFDQTQKSLLPTLERFSWSGSPLEQRLNNYIRGQELENAQVELENAFKKIENKWVDILSKDKHLLNEDTHTLNMDTHKNLQETLNQIRAEINKINADADLSRAQRDKVVAEKVGVLVDNGLKGLDFQIKSEVKDDLIDEYRNNADKSGYDALNSYKTAKYGTLEKMMSFGHQIELIEDYQDRGAYDRHMRREGRIKRNKKRLYTPE